jgi:predicted deacetylase
MAAEYLIRFDDICPTMNWDVWNKVEHILIEHQICPILAVVPDNKDKKLVVAKAPFGFWEIVRSWQARGWAIGIHGYQHVYVTGRPGVVGINDQSEFAGLNENEQESKLASALALFRKEGIDPNVWTAPGHSFDMITLRVLRKLNINVVSDGLYLWPNTDSFGIIHVPQQLWRLRRMSFGLWTVCYHHNDWTEDHIDRFRREIEKYKPHITNLHRVLAVYSPRNRNLADVLFSRVCLWAIRTRRSMRKISAAPKNYHDKGLGTGLGH